MHIDLTEEEMAYLYHTIMREICPRRNTHATHCRRYALREGILRKVETGVMHYQRAQRAQRHLA